MKKYAYLLLFFVAFQFNSNIVAQVTLQNTEKDTNTYVIIRNNGIELIGKIISDDGREVLIETKALGKIYIPKSDIKSITLLDDKKRIVNGEYRAQGAFTTRYQFSTNSFPIEKGENYAMVNLYGPEVHFAVSNNLSIGVMSTWIASPIAIALKYTIPTNNEKLNFGFGTLFGSSGYLNQGRGFGGLHWGMVSYGDRMNNVTFSVGYSYLRSGRYREFYEPGVYPAVEDPYNPGYYTFNYNIPLTSSLKFSPKTNAPIIGIGGIAAVGKKASFVFDAMILFASIKNKTIDQDVDFNYNSQTGYPSSTTVGPIVETGETVYKTTNLILMPGMRFQKSESRAFQISLAGVIGSVDGERYSFPLPMCSWFYKF